MDVINFEFGIILKIREKNEYMFVCKSGPWNPQTLVSPMKNDDSTIVFEVIRSTTQCKNVLKGKIEKKILKSFGQNMCLHGAWTPAPTLCLLSLW
jgi:hypothetical protein